MFFKNMMLNKYFVLYFMIGMINTLAGYVIIFSFMYLGIMAEVSNFIGYLLGFFVSYFLNKRYNFKSVNSHKKDLPKFATSMGLAYIANLATLSVLFRAFGVNVYIAQIVAGIIYVMCGYALSKVWVFKN